MVRQWCGAVHLQFHYLPHLLHTSQSNQAPLAAMWTLSACLMAMGSALVPLPKSVHVVAHPQRRGCLSRGGTIQVQENDVGTSNEQARALLEERNAITSEPGRRGRFSRSWSTLEKDADWLGFICGRILDALDDGLHRGNYIGEEHVPGYEERKRVVVLGSGWGANGVLSQLRNAPDCDVTVISPRNYFLFTPMLAGAALGTLEPRSIIEPIREANPRATYFEAKALSIDTEAKTVACESNVCEGVECEIREFEVPYDDLIVSVGASTNTSPLRSL